jgi:DNA-directed RNA polymerase subunit K/omega
VKNDDKIVKAAIDELATRVIPKQNDKPRDNKAYRKPSKAPLNKT